MIFRMIFRRMVIPNGRMMEGLFQRMFGRLEGTWLGLASPFQTLVLSLGHATLLGWAGVGGWVAGVGGACWVWQAPSSPPLPFLPPCAPMPSSHCFLPTCCLPSPTTLTNFTPSLTAMPSLPPLPLPCPPPPQCPLPPPACIAARHHAITFYLWITCCNFIWDISILPFLFYLPCP